MHELFHKAAQAHSRGDLTQAERQYRELLARQPEHAGALANLGLLLADRGETAAAIECYEASLRGDPRCWATHYNLGQALRAAGRLNDATASYQRALELEPAAEAAWLGLTVALMTLERKNEAMEAFGRALAWPSQNSAIRAALYGNRGLLNNDLGLLAKAEADYRAALQLAPNLALVWNSLAELCFSTGRAEEGLAYNRRAREVAPDEPLFASNLLFHLQFLPGQDAVALGSEQAAWRRKFADPLKAQIRTHANDRSPERRLRIGYVSPHFYDHAEAHFTVPLLENHDHTAYEIYCYSSVTQSDHVSERLRKHADVWRDAGHERDEALVPVIHRDGIDVLVDLTMHMGGNRALLFAQKPAPVQVCWLAYPGSTGLKSMDYRLTDSYMDPIDADTSCYTEQSIRLPDCWVVYHPLIDLVPRPPEQTGAITFGSLNNPMKLNDPLLALWAKVLRAVPGSRLRLLVLSVEQRQRIGRLMSSQGVALDRLQFAGRMARPQYLRSYDEIDIALDPLPYNGITTTCDALYMGVPVLTLTGQTAAGRAGQAMLTTIGLGELVAHTPDELVEKAARLGADLPRLIELRRGLRERFTESPLMDAPRFARNMEAAYRQMWRRWCVSGGA
jgi:protein O-GlcNAc transferase